MAGVSLRTFNNYFTGKYEALAYRQTERLRPKHRRTRRGARSPEPLWTAITESVLPRWSRTSGNRGAETGCRPVRN